MGSLTLSQKKARGQSSGWGGWGTITGADYISADNSAFVVYSANLNLTGQKLTACQVKTNFVARSGSHGATLRCYLYTSDPTVGDPISPPSGYAAYADYSVTVPYYGLYQTFSFSGLNITSGSKLYFWFVDYNSSSTADDMYHQATGNAYTAAPTCSGTFADLPMSLTVTPESVSTGNKVTINVTNGSGKNLTATLKYGNRTLATQSFTTGSCQITCPKSWFDTAGVTMLKSMTIAVTVTGGMAGNFTLTAGSDMNPIVGTPTVSIVQAASASDFPNTYLANISSAKVTASVDLPTDAIIGSVVLSFPGGTSVNMTYNSSTGKYEGTTAAPITGDTTFTVTATDMRGMTGSNTASISGVVPYSLPSAVIDEAYTYRCDVSGAKLSGGTYYRVKATASYYTALNGNSLQKFTVKIKGTSTETALSSGVQSAPISGMTNAKQSYTVVVTVQDRISGEITRELKLDGMLRDFVMKRSANGLEGPFIGIGMTPEHSSGAPTIELPSGAKIYIGGVELGNPDLSEYAKTDDFDGLAAYESIPLAVDKGGTGADNATDALANLGLTNVLRTAKTYTVTNKDTYYNFDISGASVWLVVTAYLWGSGTWCNTTWIVIRNRVAVQQSNQSGVDIYCDTNSNDKIRVQAGENGVIIGCIPLG